MTGPRVPVGGAQGRDPWGAPRAPAPVLPAANPWGSDGVRQIEDGRLEQAVRLGQQQTPDLAARILRMQDATGLPREVIARNLDQVERESKRRGFDAETFRRTSPAVAAWMAADPDHASLASDDLDQLGLIEGSLKSLSRGLSTGRQQAELGEL